MRLPFISLDSHKEIVKAKDETIAALRETNSALLETISKLSERSTATPAPMGTILRPKKKQTPVDLSMVDPNDNEALTTIALREIGTNCSMTLLQRKVDQIRRQVIQAHEDKQKKSKQPAILNEAAPAVPAEVLDVIEDAIRQGKADARV
jgi:hypothetical protein